MVASLLWECVEGNIAVMKNRLISDMLQNITTMGSSLLNG